MKIFCRISVIIFIALILGGCGFFYQKPEIVLRDMFAKMESSESFHFKTSASAVINKVLSKQDKLYTKVELNSEGNVNKDKDYFWNMDALSEIKEKDPSAEYTAELNSVYVLGKQYYKVNKVPKFGFIDLSGILNQWYFIDFKNLLPNTQSLEEKLSKEQKIEIAKYLKDADIFMVINDKAYDKVNGQKVRVLDLKINKENILGCAKKANQIAGREIFEIEKISNFLNLIKENKLTAYIGKKDNLLYRLEFEITFIDDKGITSVKSEGKIDLSKFNQADTVKEPENFKPFDLSPLISLPASINIENGQDIKSFDMGQGLSDTEREEIDKDIEEFKENMREGTE